MIYYTNIKNEEMLMLKIEEYIKDFKIKNKINEFDLANVKANKDLLIECITFYFDEYINETELEKLKEYTVKKSKNIENK